MRKIKEIFICRESAAIPLIVSSIVIFAALTIPFKILSYGFIPGDDALRHSAKAVSGKAWSQILVMRPGVPADTHPAWHAFLGLIHRLTGWDALGLVLFSVVFLFAIFSLIPILLLRRPEAWTAAMLVVILSMPVGGRLMFGRPYLLTMSVIIAIGILWPKLRADKIPYKEAAVLAFLIASATWIHCGWYLFAFPILAFLLAGEWRVSLRLTAITAIGIAAGAILTLHPYQFLKETFENVFNVYGNVALSRLLVTELQPSDGNYIAVITVALMLLWRASRKRPGDGTAASPMLILGAICWALGFISTRIWIDMGIAALLSWMACEFQEVFESRIKPLSWKRLPVAITLSLVLYLAMTSDVYSRWSSFHPGTYLSSDKKEEAPLLPDGNGIIYSADMGTFYQTFFKNPHGAWRYILFDPALMPPEDYEVYRNIQLHYGSFNAFAPWVRRMRSEDRLIIRYSPDKAPDIKGLEWRHVDDIWSGRIPPQKEKTP